MSFCQKSGAREPFAEAVVAEAAFAPVATSATRPPEAAACWPDPDGADALASNVPAPAIAAART